MLLLAAGTAACALALAYYLTTSATRMFRRLIGKPIPPSVREIRTGGFQGMGGDSFWATNFKVNRHDAEGLVQRLKLRALGDANFSRFDRESGGTKVISKAEFLQLWQERIRGYAKLPVVLSSDWLAYGANGNEVRYLFLDTKAEEAVYVAVH